MSTHWRLAVASVMLFISALAAPQNDHVKQQAIPADTVVITAADPQDGDLSTTDPGGLGHDLTSDLPNSMTSTKALQRSATQESEADSSDAAPDVRSSQSGWYTPPHSNPWFFHQLSPETLRQCASVAGRSQRSDDEERDGGRDKKVLRALGCTQAVLGDGQLRIVAGLGKIQTALWEKVEYLKECIEDVLHKVSDISDGGQVDEQYVIKDGVATLNSVLLEVFEFVQNFQSGVLSDTASLKRGQSSILTKLVSAQGDVAILKDGIAWLNRTGEGMRDGVGKQLTQLIESQPEIKEEISSLEMLIKARLDDIKTALDSDIASGSNIADALNELASSVAMIKSDQLMIKSSLDSTKAVILSDTAQLWEDHRVVIDKLRKRKQTIWEDTSDLKNGQDEIKTDLASVKDMVLADLEQLGKRQGKTLRRFDDFRNIEPKVDMIKQSQSSLETAVQVNMDKISEVDDKLTELTTKFSSFASKQNRLTKQLSQISEVLETLTAKVMSCCGTGDAHS